jgi:hypothetical protein
VQDDKVTEAERSYATAPYDIKKVGDLLIGLVHQRANYGDRRVRAAIQFGAKPIDETKWFVTLSRAARFVSRKKTV